MKVLDPSLIQQLIKDGTEHNKLAIEVSYGVQALTKIESGVVVTKYLGLLIFRGCHQPNHWDKRYFFSMANIGASNVKKDHLSQTIIDGQFYSWWKGSNPIISKYTDTLGPCLNHNFHPNCRVEIDSIRIFQDDQHWIWAACDVVTVSPILPGEMLTLKYCLKGPNQIENDCLRSNATKEFYEGCIGEDEKSKTEPYRHVKKSEIVQIMSYTAEHLNQSMLTKFH